MNILTKLANDPAIRHVMALHKFSVGLLTELAPHEHPNLLGLNEVCIMRVSNVTGASLKDLL